MYYIIELQKTDDAHCVHLISTKETQNEAESAYHQVLAAAAISSVPEHSATLLTDNGRELMNQTYYHAPAPEQEAEEE